MGKTETIKDRSIYVYLPSVDMVEKWKKLAEGQGTSVSKFVREHVENSLRQEMELGYRSRGELLKELGGGEGSTGGGEEEGQAPGSGGGEAGEGAGGGSQRGRSVQP